MSQAREKSNYQTKAKLANPRLSSRGGAFIIRSVSLFLAGGCKASKSSHGALNSGSFKKCDKRKMAEENSVKNSNKCSIRLMEILKRDTHFNKYVSLTRVTLVCQLIIDFKRLLQGRNRSVVQDI